MSKKVLSLVILILFCFLSGCFDLGSFGSGQEIHNEADLENTEQYFKAYYEAIGTIYLATQDKSVKDFSLKNSFFSNKTVNDLTWEKDSYKVDTNEYIYMAIEAKKDIEMDSISLYMKGSSSLASGVNVSVYVYVLDKYKFSSIPNYSDSLIKKDDDGKIVYESDGITPKKESYDFMDKSSALGSSSVTVSSSAFESFTIDKFTSNADTVKVKKDQYIILSFYNNTAYGNQEKLTKVGFTALNLLIRAV